MLPYTGHNVKAAHVMSYLALLAKYCVGEAVVCYARGSPARQVCSDTSMNNATERAKSADTTHTTARSAAASVKL